MCEKVLIEEITLLRLPEVLSILPISKSHFLQKVKDGVFPRGIKIGPRTTAWKLKDIAALIKELESKSGEEAV